MRVLENKNIVDALNVFGGGANGRFCAFKNVYESLVDGCNMKVKIDANFDFLTRLFDACEKMSYGKVIDVK